MFPDPADQAQQRWLVKFPSVPGAVEWTTVTCPKVNAKHIFLLSLDQHVRSYSIWPNTFFHLQDFTEVSFPTVVDQTMLWTQMLILIIPLINNMKNDIWWIRKKVNHSSDLSWLVYYLPWGGSRMVQNLTKSKLI